MKNKIIYSFSIVSISFILNMIINFEKTQAHQKCDSSLCIISKPHSHSYPHENQKNTQINFCNSLSTKSTYIAIGFPNGDSRGWYSVKPSNCRKVSLGRYEGEIFYYVLKDKNSTDKDQINQEKQPFCINLQDKFNFSEKFACEGNNLQKVNMKPVRVTVGNLTLVNLK